MNEENKLIIKQLNKFGRVLETSELLKMIEVLEDNWNKLKKFVEEEKNRLAIQVSNTYEDSLGKRRFVNEDIFNELVKVSGKMQELEQGKDE